MSKKPFVAKKAQAYQRGMTMEESVDGYFNGMQQVAAAKVSGNYKRGDIPPSVFKKPMERWYAERTTPDLVPYIDGEIVTIESYEEFIRANINDMAEVYKRVALKSSPGGGPGAVKWSRVSAAHTAVTGSYKAGPFELKMKEYENNKQFYTTNKPGIPIRDWLLEELKHNLYVNDIGAPGGGAFKFSIVYEGEEPNSIYWAKAQVLVKNKDGNLTGATGGELFFDYDLVFLNDKNGTPLEHGVVVDDSTMNAMLDIEHLRSVASESIEGMIRGLTGVLGRIEEALSKKSNSTEQTAIFVQMKEDVTKQLKAARENKSLADKVGRVVSTPLDQRLTTEEFKKLVEALPEQDGMVGLNMLVYNKVTQSFDLSKVDVTHTVEVDFIPGLAKFNRGIASALERAAKNAVEDALLSPASPSPFTRIMHGVFYKVFGEKDFLTSIQKRLGGNAPRKNIYSTI